MLLHTHTYTLLTATIFGIACFPEKNKGKKKYILRVASHIDKTRESYSYIFVNYMVFYTIINR